MIPCECKRLAEVDFPYMARSFGIAEVSKHAAQEKSIRHGHPSTLHLVMGAAAVGFVAGGLMALSCQTPATPLSGSVQE